MVLTAVPVIRKGLRLWTRPDSLKPESLTYRIYVSWMRARQPDVWKKQSGKLTDGDIKFFAVLDLLGGLMLVVFGAIYLFEP